MVLNYSSFKITAEKSRKAFTAGLRRENGRGQSVVLMIFPFSLFSCLIRGVLSPSAVMAINKSGSLPQRKLWRQLFRRVSHVSGRTVFGP